MTIFYARIDKKIFHLIKVFLSVCETKFLEEVLFLGSLLDEQKKQENPATARIHACGI